MVYIVEVGYNKFNFTDCVTAITYADMSKAKATEDIPVTITLEDGEDE